jgi:ribosomal-protein-alanine N-acetyltransferase
MTTIRHYVVSGATEGAFMNTGTAEKQFQRVHIRWMIRRDMPEVLQIEQDSHDYPWTEEDFLHCLRQRNCIGMVAEMGEQVVGFMIYELHKSKLHILNFAVHPKQRRKKVGNQMVQKLISKLSSHRRTCITLEVRETSLESQLFFRHVGFSAMSVLREHFPDTGEDAYLMQYRYPLPESAANSSVDSLAQLEE